VRATTIVATSDGTQRSMVTHTSMCGWAISHDPLTLQRESLSFLSHYKTRWTMTVDNVSLIINLLETSNSLITLTCFFMMGTEMVPGRMQRPITYVRGVREDFMVHDVKQPISGNLQPHSSKLQCQAAPVWPSTIENRTLTICFLPCQT
jgi:hypothetical protein